MAQILSTQYVEFSPMNNISDKLAPIVFNFQQQDGLIDLSQTFYYLRLKTTNKKGEKIKPDQNISPANLLGYSLFESVNLYLNDRLVTTNTKLYPWMAYTL